MTESAAARQKAGPIVSSAWSRSSKSAEPCEPPALPGRSAAATPNVDALPRRSAHRRPGGAGGRGAGCALTTPGRPQAQPRSSRLDPCCRERASELRCSGGRAPSRVGRPVRSRLPVSAPDIVKRLEQITFNGVFLREAAALTTMARVAGSGSQDPAFSRKLQKLRLHHISAEREHSALSEASGGNLEWQFLRTLRESGRAAAESWLDHGNGVSEPIMQQGMLRAAE